MNAIYHPPGNPNHGRQTKLARTLEREILNPLEGFFRKAVLEGASIREAAVLAHRAVDDSECGAALGIAVGGPDSPENQPAPDSATLFVGPNGRWRTREAKELENEFETMVEAFIKKALVSGRSLTDIQALCQGALDSAFLMALLELGSKK